MLRITVMNDVRGATFKMEGKLAHEWVMEAEKAWTAFSNIPNQERVVVDLCGVSFVDDSGRELLARMHSCGAKLIGTGPMTSALIEEVCAGDKPRDGRWIRSVLSLFFLLPLFAAMLGNNGLFNYLRFSFSGDATPAIQRRIVPINHSARYGPIPSEKSRVIPFWKGLSR